MNTNEDRQLLSEIKDMVQALNLEFERHRVFAEVKLDSIEKQAVATNGRVTNNANNIERLKDDLSKDRLSNTSFTAKVTAIASTLATGITIAINKFL